MSEKNSSLAKMILIRIIILLIIALVGSCITTQLIKEDIAKRNSQGSVPENKISTNEKIENTQSKPHVQEKTIDLEDTYDLNGLKTILCKEEFAGVEVQYYKVDGLKNENIEKEINYTLKNDVIDFMKKAQKENKIAEENFYANAYVNSNFANTLSIVYYFSSYRIEGEDQYGNPLVEEDLLNDSIVENFDLTTGEKINLYDLFIEDFKAQKLMSHDFYTQLVSSSTEQQLMEDGGDLYVTDYNDIEETMLEFVTSFNNRKEMPFVFDEQKIMLLDYNVNIFYEDYLDSITIYNKYQTQDSIFDGQYEALTDLPTLTKRYYADYFVIEEKENYYIDISLFDVYEYEVEYRDKTVFELAKKYVDGVVEEIKQKAKENPNQFYIFNYAYRLGTVSNLDAFGFEPYDGILRLDGTRIEYETTKSKYTSEVSDQIQKVFRTAQRIEGGEAYCYDNLFLNFMENIDWEEITYAEPTTVYYNANGEMFDSEQDALRGE